MQQLEPLRLQKQRDTSSWSQCLCVLFWCSALLRNEAQSPWHGNHRLDTSSMLHVIFCLMFILLPGNEKGKKDMQMIQFVNKSLGEEYPFREETSVAEDSYDAVAWIAARSPEEVELRFTFTR